MLLDMPLSYKTDGHTLSVRGLFTVHSPWQVPLPWAEYTTSQVAIYFYRGSWIPITFYPLVEAIKLHRNASSSGRDIVLFPCDLDPRSSESLCTQAPHPLVLKLKDNKFALTNKSSQYAEVS
jgi:hypothetical protein